MKSCVGQWLSLLTCVLVWTVLILATRLSVALAAERIIEHEPYDQLVLKGDARVFKLVPLDMAKREPLSAKDPEDVLVVRLADHPAQKYQVKWRAIERVELFEELVLQEAAGLVTGKQYDEAHEYYVFLHRRAPDFPGLSAARQSGLLSEARCWLDQKRAQQALVVLWELWEQNREYPALREAIGLAVDPLVEEYFAAGEDAAARELVEQLAARYADHEVVVARRQQLVARAEAFLQTARAAMEGERWREAHDAIQTSLSLWPALAESQRLARELNARYPLIRVGVRDLDDAAGAADWTPTWSTLRHQRLTARCLFEAQAAPDGVEYLSPLGTYQVTGTTLTFHVDAGVHGLSDEQAMTGADLAARLIGPTDGPTDRTPASWRAWVDVVRVVDQRSLELTWIRQPPFWESWLAIPCPRQPGLVEAETDRLGPYRPAAGEGGERRFVAERHYFAARAQQPREVIERKIDSTIDALRALDQQRILVFDRVAPWELAVARTHPQVALVRYAAPTVHLLVPNPRSLLMTPGAVRRAVSAAIDRERILTEVMGDGASPAGEVLTGPFPRGYAYDDAIAAPCHDPRLAIALLRSGVIGAAGQTDSLRLTLVYDRSDMARRAAVAIQEQLQLGGLGFRVELREATDGTNRWSDSSWDLLLAEWPVMEPARDVWKLLAAVQGAGRADPQLEADLEQLAQADTRDRARPPLCAIHRRVHEQLTVIPLWQFHEHALVHRTLRGVGERPVTLYQQVEQWQVTSEP